jgi:hypothetical protein
MKGATWTLAEDEYVRSHYLTVDTYMLALDLGRPPQAVRNRANLLGLARSRCQPKPARPLTDIWRAQEERATKYLSCRSAGMTSLEIAGLFGTTKNAVIGTINRYLKRVS